MSFRHWWDDWDVRIFTIPRQHYDASVGSAVVEAAEIISQKFSGMMENIGD